MIYFPTPDPVGLLDRLKSLVETGKIKSWSVDEDGDFTPSTEMWNKSAWLRPEIEPDNLVFFILRPRGEEISKAVYAVLHGRMIETVLRHLDERIVGQASASAMPAGNDDVG